MIEKLKLLDQDGKLDPGFLLFYYVLLGGALTMESFPFAVLSLIALATFIVITYRDLILKAKKSPNDEIKERLDSLESELTALKIHEGIRTLK